MKILIFLFTFVISHQSYGQRIESIYGKDKRQNYYELPAELKALSKSQVALVSEDDLTLTENNQFKINTSNLGDVENLCPEERFINEPTLSNCSGIIWSENYVITAGHCINSKSCKNTYIVTNYFLKSTSDTISTISSKNVYRCSEVVARSNSNSLDYAIIKLDRPAQDFNRIKLENPSLNEGGKVYALGFPSGLPLKFSGYGEVQSLHSNFFSANISGFEGNSGSPVFKEETNELIGLYVRGEKDYIWDRNRRCNKAFICKDKLCSGEEIIYFKSILNDLNNWK